MEAPVRAVAREGVPEMPLRPVATGARDDLAIRVEMAGVLVDVGPTVAADGAFSAAAAARPRAYSRVD